MQLSYPPVLPHLLKAIENCPTLGTLGTAIDPAQHHKSHPGAFCP